MIILNLDHTTPYGFQSLCEMNQEPCTFTTEMPFYFCSEVIVEKTFWEMAKLDTLFKSQCFLWFPFW